MLSDRRAEMETVTGDSRSFTYYPEPGTADCFVIGVSRRSFNELGTIKEVECEIDNHRLVRGKLWHVYIN